jgi:hypothetical protein
MKSRYDPDSLRELAGDIEAELAKLARLEGQIQHVQNEVKKAPQYTELFYESLAIKFHNFYIGCFELDIQTFVEWLNELAISLDEM